jgi:oxygen-dependent protoporphyrinogen oxidase
MKKIVVIGGGISGLSTMYYLKKKLNESNKEAELILLEKSDRLGGQIKTEYPEEFVIDGGSDCFIREKPWALKLCKELGIEDNLINTQDENGGTFIYRKKKLHKLPEGLMALVPSKFLEFATTGLFSIFGKLRMSREIFVPMKKNHSDETLSSFIKRRFGRELLDMIAEPLIAGIHAGDPERMSLKSTFPRFLEMEQDFGSLTRATLASRKKMKEMKKISKGTPSSDPQYSFFISFKRGMYQFVESLVDRIRDLNLETGKNVKSIEKSDNGKYEVVLDNNEIIKAESVIITTPAYVTSELLKNFNEKISNELAKIPYVKTGTISIAYKKEDIKNMKKAFGFLVPGVEKRKIMAATFTSMKWPNRCPDEFYLIRCFIGGKYNQQMIELDDDTIISTVKNELKSILGIDAEPYLYRIFRWVDNMPQYNIGHLDLLENIDNEILQYKGFQITGSAYRGIGIPDCINNAEIVAGKVIEETL